MSLIQSLIDSHTFHDPIDVTGEDVELLTELLKDMLTIRSAEKLARGRQEGKLEADSSRCRSRGRGCRHGCFVKENR